MSRHRDGSERLTELVGERRVAGETAEVLASDPPTEER
jgi:hypothetical protein